MPSLVTAVSIHTESLHLDPVWEKLKDWLKSSGLIGIRSTLFIYPFRSRIAGIPIKDRVQWLIEHGYELGLHTHFYRGAELQPGKKIDDLSAENVELCLSRDCDELKEYGCIPRGFISGNWQVTDEISLSLKRHGITYDCSMRLPWQRPASGTAAMRFAMAPQVHASTGIRCLPTTGPVTRWVNRNSVAVCNARSGGSLEYQLLYFHDYDLVQSRTKLALMALKNFCRKRQYLNVEEICNLVFNTKIDEQRS